VSINCTVLKLVAPPLANYPTQRTWLERSRAVKLLST